MEPILGEIFMFPFNWAPRGFLSCDGQLLQIKQHAALYTYLGTAYGGDGVNTFALPNLNGRAVIGAESQAARGSSAGTDTVTLTVDQIPSHTHAAYAASVEGASARGNSRLFAKVKQFQSYTPINIYSGDVSSLQELHASTVRPTGGSQPHDNMQPYLVVNFCIAVEGVYPPRP